jgi:hypothetical protein
MRLEEAIKKCSNCFFSLNHWCKGKKNKGYSICFEDPTKKKEVFKDSNCINWKLKNEQ